MKYLTENHLAAAARKLLRLVNVSVSGARCDHLAVAEDRGRRHFYPIPIVDEPIGRSMTMPQQAWYPISLVQRVLALETRC